MGTRARPRRRCHFRSRTVAAVVAVVVVAASAAAAHPQSAAATPVTGHSASRSTGGEVTREVPVAGATATGRRSRRKPTPLPTVAAPVAAAMAAAAAREVASRGAAAGAPRAPSALPLSLTRPGSPPPPAPMPTPTSTPSPTLSPTPSPTPTPTPPPPPTRLAPPPPLPRAAGSLARARTRASSSGHSHRGWAEIVAARASCALAERRHHVPSYRVNGGEGQEQADLVFEEIIDDISRIMDACEWSGRGDTWPDEQLDVDDVDDGSRPAGDSTSVARGQAGYTRQESVVLRFFRRLHDHLLQVQGKATLASALPKAPAATEGGSAGAAGGDSGGSGAGGGRADSAAAAAAGGEVETLRRTSRSAAEAYERLRRVAAQSLQWHLRQANVTGPQRDYITRHMNNIYLY